MPASSCSCTSRLRLHNALGAGLLLQATATSCVRMLAHTHNYSLCATPIVSLSLPQLSTTHPLVLTAIQLYEKWWYLLKQGGVPVRYQRREGNAPTSKH